MICNRRVIGAPRRPGNAMRPLDTGAACPLPLDFCREGFASNISRHRAYHDVFGREGKDPMHATSYFLRVALIVALACAALPVPAFAQFDPITPQTPRSGGNPGRTIFEE